MISVNMVVLFGYEIPLWLFMILGIIFVVLAWKLIKFALVVLFILIIFLVILMGLDFLGVFEKLQNLIANVI